MTPEKKWRKPTDQPWNGWHKISWGHKVAKEQCWKSDTKQTLVNACTPHRPANASSRTLHPWHKDPYITKAWSSFTASCDNFIFLTLSTFLRWMKAVSNLRKLQRENVVHNHTKDFYFCTCWKRKAIQICSVIWKHTSSCMWSKY